MANRNRDIVEAFPAFRRIVNLPWHSAWQGELTPLFQTYVLRIDYAPGMNDGEFDYPKCPISIQVLGPELTRRAGSPQFPIPHLYRQPDGVKPPKLCLFWPQDQEWTSLDSIAEFIFPWISEWFLNYEIWLATGQWASPEAPHDVTADENLQQLDSREEDRSGVLVGSKREKLDRSWLVSSALANLPYFVKRYLPLK